MASWSWHRRHLAAFVFCGSKKSPTCSFSKFQSRTCKQSQMAACTLADIVCLGSLVSNSPNTKSPMAACMHAQVLFFG